MLYMVVLVFHVMIGEVIAFVDFFINMDASSSPSPLSSQFISSPCVRLTQKLQTLQYFR